MNDINADHDKPLLLLDIHHSGYFGWGPWMGTDKPEQWTAQTVERLERHPHYKMGLNLGAMTYQWSPHFAGRIRQWLKQFPGRLCITGGDYGQPTACVRTGEANLRQLIYGRQVIHQTLAYDVTIWTVSEPGNFAQLPQVLNELGYRGALLRIHGPGQEGSLTPRADEASVWWQGPDGSRILTVPEYHGDRETQRGDLPISMWMMTRYRNQRAAKGDFTLDDFWRWKQKHAAKGIEPVVMSKDDDHNDQPGGNNLCMSSGHLLAADTTGDRRFHWVTGEELFASLPAPRTTLVADPNLFETRVRYFCNYGYRGNQDWQVDLATEAALRMGDFAVTLAPDPAPGAGRQAEWEPTLHRAWQLHLGAQNHDVNLPNSYDLSMHLQFDARRQAQMVRDDGVESLLSQVNTGGTQAGALAVFNPLGAERTDYAQVELPEGRESSLQPCLDGKPIEWETVHRHVGRTIMGFVANVPALGYQVYQLRPAGTGAGAGQANPIIRQEGSKLTATTAGYTAELDGEHGGLTGLWTPKGTAVAGRSLQILSAANARPVRSNGPIEVLHNGPLSAVARESGTLGEHYRYQITYRFTRGLPYIRVQVYLAAHYNEPQPGQPDPLGTGLDVTTLSLRLKGDPAKTVCMRYQPCLTWPYDLALDPVFAAPYWVDMSDGAAGVAWLNAGDLGYRYDRAEHRLDNILWRGRVNEQSWEVALLPHDGDWLAGRVQEWGLNFGNPLYACHVPSHAGALPPRSQLCAIEPETVSVSSAFRANGRNYVRVYEHAGQPAQLRLTRHARPLEIERVDLHLQPRGKSSSLELGPYKIATLALA